MIPSAHLEHSTRLDFNTAMSWPSPTQRISNTYFLDRCAGWSGLCIEPNPIYHGGLRAHRSCRLVPTCMSDSISEVEMLLPPSQWLGGLGGVANGSMSKYAKKLRSWYPPKSWRHSRMNCTRFSEEMSRVGWAHVDFLSLDVDPQELEHWSSCMHSCKNSGRVPLVVGRGPRVDQHRRPL